MAGTSNELAKRADKIKECFRKFDADENGFISKNELRQLLGMLCKSSELTDEDVDQCLHEADTNGNGAIEYSEFIDWLMRPGASIGTTQSGRLHRFNLEKALKPLFKVYDRNGDGTITSQEYVECHTIMQNALKLCPARQEDPHDEPDILQQDAEEAFNKIDADHNHTVTFDEFIEYQRNALMKSGLTNDDLEELIPALSRQLARIFKVVESEEQGEALDEAEEALLRKMIENVATFSRDLWNTHYENKNSIRDKVHYANRWVEPPVGLNINDLKKKHLLLRPMKFFGVESINLDVFCIPAMPQDAENSALLKRREVRSWLASVSVQIIFKNGGPPTSDGPYYYRYHDLSWEPAQQLGNRFHSSVEAFAPELRVYCLLRCEANFAIDLKWQQVQDALRNAIKAGYMTEAQFQEYNKHMELRVAQAIYEEGLEGGAYSPSSSKKERQDRIEHLVVSAHSVMLVLADLNIMEVSSAWTDFIHPQQ
mmetsp:Transcript_20208/g.47142  ORF Transcript_20208/g.47142 Transcript_20208/m.47142 type:complete len:483 (+) Transcript_20208:117-1565(+)